MSAVAPGLPPTPDFSPGWSNRSARSTVKNFAGSYGSLVASVKRDADGLVSDIVYGDAASTTTGFSYDNRRRLSSVTTYRGPPTVRARKLQYDDLYRVTQVDYQYASGDDIWTDPFDAEDTGTDPDPRRAAPSPHVAFDKRVQRQTFQYDWLGDTSRTDDDAHGFYDRSLGEISHGSVASCRRRDAAPASGGWVLVAACRCNRVFRAYAGR